MPKSTNNHKTETYIIDETDAFSENHLKVFIPFLKISKGATVKREKRCKQTLGY